MNRVFFVHVKQFAYHITAYTNNKGLFYNDFVSKLHELCIYLENYHDIEITISEENIETMSAVVTINERDYNKFILLNKHAFYETCQDLSVSVSNISYEISFNTTIEWNEVDKNGDYV